MSAPLLSAAASRNHTNHFQCLTRVPFPAFVVCLFPRFSGCCINPAAPPPPFPSRCRDSLPTAARHSGFLVRFSSQFRGLAAISSHPRREHPVSLLASHLFALPPRPGPLHLPGVPAQGSPQRAVPGCGPLFNWLINSGGAVGARRGSPRRRAAGRCRLPPLYRLPGSPSHILGGGGLNEEALIATEKCPNNFFSG